ncbi:DUF6011 domain-containing protein [Sinorhizobium fredii]|uniref:DUF6011 domain-containing protein n=1 Tax=Rhizobium fredii TaxID=380 RepID=UPI0012980828|nr:DUF6011 domain-containing protein [Sinorhizobium fredii]MQW94089.1 hypothetical protein [Sinorhizobium fredii]
MNLKHLQAAKLKEKLALLPKSDQGFAASLINQLDSKGQLSDKQWSWVERLADAIDEIGVPDFTTETVDVGEVGGVIALFQKAKQHLKYPKITLQLVDGMPLQLALAGPNSKAPGTVTLTDGGPYGRNTWYGRVTAEGTWQPSAKLSDGQRQALLQLLTKLSAEPAETAASYGKLTGHCCFCNSSLSDEKSTAVGYGPICAKRWGLPWGKTSIVAEAC